MEAWRFDWTTAAALSYDDDLMADSAIAEVRRCAPSLVELAIVIGAAEPRLIHVASRFRTWLRDSLESGFAVGDRLSAHVVDRAFALELLLSLEERFARIDAELSSVEGGPQDLDRYFNKWRELLASRRTETCLEESVTDRFQRAWPECVALAQKKIDS